MKLAKYNKLVNFIFAAIILLVCMYALHDMQTAEGIGLFFAMKLGVEQCLFVDVAVDLLCIGALVLLVYLPVKYLKPVTEGACLRLLIGYLAVVPSLSLSELIGLFGANGKEFFWDMGILTTWEAWTNIYLLLPFLQMWIPLFLILFAVSCTQYDFTLKKWHRVFLTSQLVMIGILIILPQAENLVLYLFGYFGLLIAFDCWEYLYERTPQWKKWYNLFFVLMLLRGIYRIVVLMSRF